jgi:uncharacterized protein
VPTAPGSGVRLVLDTNTAVSGLLWPGGPPARLLDAAEARQIELASSTALLAELEGVLSRAKFARQLARRNLKAADLFDGYAVLVVHVTHVPPPRRVSRDPDDDQVLACALAANADAIVSGDGDLLDLESYQGIPILTAAQAVERIEEQTQ